MENKHFEIQVANGNHTLHYECSTMSEAYGCLGDLKSMSDRLNRAIDLDYLMVVLVGMGKGSGTKCQPMNGLFSIFLRDGEV